MAIRFCFWQYVEELNSTLSNVSRESREMTNRLHVIEAVHSNRLDLVEHQSLLTQHTIDRIADNVSSLHIAVSPLLVMPKAVTELEWEMAYNVEKLESAVSMPVLRRDTVVAYW